MHFKMNIYQCFFIGKLLTWDHLSAPENSVELKTVAGWIGGGISEMEEETPGNFQFD